MVCHRTPCSSLEKKEKQRNPLSENIKFPHDENKSRSRFFKYH
jgi:hypothetical protein